MLDSKEAQVLVDNIQGTKTELNLLLLEAQNAGLEIYLSLKYKDISMAVRMRYVHIDCALPIPSTRGEPECP